MPRAERIAFVCPRLAEAGTVGGAEVLLKNLAERLVGLGRQVDFLTTCAQSHFTWENTLPAGIRQAGPLRVHFFPVDGRDVETFLRIQTAISRKTPIPEADERQWLAHSVNSSALYEHLRKEGQAYDRIIMGPYLFGLVWAAAQIHPEKTLLVPCLHDEPFAYLKSMRQLFNQVAGFMFNTVPEQELAQRLFDQPRTKNHVVGMGLDLFEVDATAFQKHRKIAAPFVLYAGRREPLKGTPLLCDYMLTFRERTKRDIKVVFTGSGPIEPPPALASHIIDLGYVSEQEKHEAMAGAMAFIHPSVNESLGIVLLEAWLAQTPGLVHAHSKVLRWQCRQSNAGLWFRNYPEFEEELLMILDQPGLRGQLGAAGRAYVLREYSWSAVEKKLLAALDDTA